MTGPFAGMILMKLFRAQGYRMQKSIIQKNKISVRKEVVLGGWHFKLYADVDFSGTFSWQIFAKNISISGFQNNRSLCGNDSCVTDYRSGLPYAEIYYPENKIGVRKEVYKTIESYSNSFLRVFILYEAKLKCIFMILYFAEKAALTPVKKNCLLPSPRPCHD